VAALEEVRDMMEQRATNLTGAPTVGVVVPCYNYARYLSACLDSVLAQPGVTLDVLVIDDASSDDTRAVAEDYAARDSRVRVISHSVNAGHILSYNEGLSDVQGEFLVLLSADDALAPGSLQRATSVLASHPAVGFVYGPVRSFSGEIPRKPIVPRLAATKVWPGSRWLERRTLLVTNCITSPEVVMRRAVYEGVGPYDPALPHTGDLAMWMRAASITDVAYVHGPPAAFYRQHAGNMHKEVFKSGQTEGMLVDLRQRRQTIEAVFVDNADARAALMRDTAMRQLAAEALGAAARAYTWGLTADWPVDDLERFAEECWPDYRELAQFRSLERRRERGTGPAVGYPPFVFAERVLQVRRAWRRLRQKWTGT
jgi:glycosyltransferase involved in cell wall biosynthesis